MLKTVDGIRLPFLKIQLEHEDLWTRHDAANALAEMGERALPSAKSLEKLLSDKYVVNRLKAAKAIFCISGIAFPLEQQLAAVFETRDDRDQSDRSSGLETIAELKQAGLPYLHYVVEEIHSAESDLAEGAIEAVAAIESKDAIIALKETAKSTDWILRSAAITALRQLTTPAGQ
jgi:HEAT repeat protein